MMILMTMTGEIDLTDPRTMDLINALITARAFEVRDGKVIINFHSGHVQNIVVEERRYQHIVIGKSTHVPI